MARLQDSCSGIQKTNRTPVGSPGTPRIISGTDEGVDLKNERMGAGYVTGTERATETSLSAGVGGTLSTFRAEAASSRQLLLDLRDKSSNPLLVTSTALCC